MRKFADISSVYKFVVFQSKLFDNQILTYISSTISLIIRFLQLHLHGPDHVGKHPAVRCDRRRQLNGKPRHKYSLPFRDCYAYYSQFESKPSSLSTDSSSSRALLRERSMQSHTLHHSSETWERHRLQITELYVTQGKKLREVADLMKTTYKFKATSV